MKKVALAILGFLAFAASVQSDVGLANQKIQRIASSSNGFSFLYINPGLLPTSCNATIGGVAGPTFSAIVIPTKDMLSILLSAQAQGKDIPFMLVFTAGPSVYIPGAGSLNPSCRLEMVDISK